MKAYEIADSFRAQFAADDTFDGNTINVAQSGQQSVKRPLIEFECAATPMNADGSAITYTVAAWVESNADKALSSDPDPALAHKALVEAVRAKLIGAGKAALLTALNAAAVFDWRGWSPSPSELQISDLHFRTQVPITGTLLVL